MNEYPKRENRDKDEPNENTFEKLESIWNDIAG